MISMDGAIESFSGRSILTANIMISRRFRKLATVIAISATLSYLVVISQLFMLVSGGLAAEREVGPAKTGFAGSLQAAGDPMAQISLETSISRQEYLPLVRWPPDNTARQDRLGVHELHEQARLPSNLYPPDEDEDPGRRAELAVARILLPDLRTLVPTDFRLVSLPATGRRLVRFSNHIWNAGPGRLELHSYQDTNLEDHTHEGEPAEDEHHDHAEAGETHRVSQSIYNEQGEAVVENVVGEYVFHPAHAHWHLDGFAIYEVWSIDEDGNLQERLTTSGKISYCVTDTRTVDRDLAGDTPYARQGYGACYRDVQGLSVNWVDTYAFHLPDQWVEVTDLPEGVYALRSMADPEDRIFEANDQNNARVVYFKLEQWRVSVISLTALTPEKKQ